MILKKKIIGVLMLAAMVSIFAIGCSQESAPEGNENVETGEAVAIVNGEEISKEDFDYTVQRISMNYEQQGLSLEGEQGEAVLEGIREEAMDILVEERILLQEAIKNGHSVTDEEVEEEFESLKGQFSSQEDFEEILEMNLLTEERLKKMLKTEMHIERFFKEATENVEVSEAESKEAYDRYFEEIQGTEAEEDFPSYEEIKYDLEFEIMQEKQNAEFRTIIETLKADSEINILI